jgi:hypothetical protein
LKILVQQGMLEVKKWLIPPVRSIFKIMTRKDSIARELIIGHSTQCQAPGYLQWISISGKDPVNIKWGSNFDEFSN